MEIKALSIMHQMLCDVGTAGCLGNENDKNFQWIVGRRDRQEGDFGGSGASFSKGGNLHDHASQSARSQHNQAQATEKLVLFQQREC